MSNIKKSGRLALCFDVLVRAVKAIPEDLRPEQLRSVLEPSFKTDTLYRAKAQEGESKLTVLLQLCQQTLDLLQNLPDEMDEQTHVILKCPAGQVPTRVSINNSQTVAHFELGTCEQCPLRAMCYS